MNTLNTIQELRDLVNRSNYHFEGLEFSGYLNLKKGAEDYFKSITEGFENKEDYYFKFGGVHLEKVKIEKYFVDEVNLVVTVEFYEGYIDSGVNEEDYFHGFLIEY